MKSPDRQMPGAAPAASSGQGGLRSAASPNRSGRGRPAAPSGSAHPRRSERHASEPAHERFFRIEDVAELLDVCTRTVRRFIARKELPAHDFGGAVRIAESDFKAFIERHRRS